MKSNSFLKPIAMILLAFLIGSSTQAVFAQQVAPAANAPEKNKTADDQKFKKDYDSKMAKFEDTYQKLKQKEASTTNPEMKADLDKMLSRMDAVKGDMKNYMANKDHMSEEQKAKAHDQIKGQMEDIKQIHDQVKTKYGGKSSGGSKGNKNQNTNPDKQPKDHPKEPKSTNDRQPKDQNSTNPK